MKTITKRDLTSVSSVITTKRTIVVVGINAAKLNVADDNQWPYFASSVPLKRNLMDIIIRALMNIEIRLTEIECVPIYERNSRNRR